MDRHDLGGRLEHPHPAAGPLGHIGGHVGPRHQLFDLGAVIGGVGDADGAGDGELDAVELDLTQRDLVDALAQIDDLLAGGRAGVHEGELVTADAGRHRQIAESRLVTHGQDAEQAVTGRMAEGVIHLLEPIEVDDEQGDEGLPARPTVLRHAGPGPTRVRVRPGSSWR